MTMMTERQAYIAMHHFLDLFYRSTGSDDVAGLLSAMSLLANGEPADPGVGDEWKESVEYALNGGRADLIFVQPDDPAT
jgi:hypothetical protein